MSVFFGQTEREIDEMWEKATEAEWERQNADDPDVEKIKAAGDELCNTYDHISEAMKSLGKAVKEVEETVAYDRLVSLLDALSDLRTEIFIMRDNMKEGHC